MREHWKTVPFTLTDEDLVAAKNIDPLTPDEDELMYLRLRDEETRYSYSPFCTVRNHDAETCVCYTDLAKLKDRARSDWWNRLSDSQKTAYLVGCGKYHERLARQNAAAIRAIAQHVNDQIWKAMSASTIRRIQRLQS